MRISARQNQFNRSRKHKDEIISKLQSLDDDNLGVMFKGLLSGEELAKVTGSLPSKKTLIEKAEKILTSDTLPTAVDYKYEAIIKLFTRPVYLVKNGLPELTGMEVEKWKGRIESALSSFGLGDAIAAVGRIEGENHPEYDWFGTGWLLDDDLIVTNRHVAGLFSMRNENNLTFRKYNDQQVFPRIDFLSEYGNNGTGQQYEFIKPVYMATSNEPDVAIFQVKWISDRPAKPLDLCKDEPKLEEDIAIIGYPAFDSRSRLGRDMQRIFNNIYDVKRFAPGEISSLVKNDICTHDATTLGGNSGSPVVSLENGKALGIHFAGQEQKNNFFVSAKVLQKLKDKVGGRSVTGVSLTPPPAVVSPTANITTPVHPVATDTSTDQQTSTAQTMKKRAHFLITALNDPETIDQIESILYVRYADENLALELAMPGNATEGESELFSFSAMIDGNIHEEAERLRTIPGVEFAEADIKLFVDAAPEFIGPGNSEDTESFLIGDGFGKWNETTEIIARYPVLAEMTPEARRRWNWERTNFDKIQFNDNNSPVVKGVRIVQFDTGYSKHKKVFEGFNLEDDQNFLEKQDDAFDPQTPGFGQQPGHGTRTASLLVGKPNSGLRHDGNAGLLSPFEKFKVVPYRIAKSVILINRQRDLADALDKAISQGFDVISMSMGLPPTIATARMAKKAYDKGVIWCCAAGNVVQAVVAPAVYPGTIAVAASNPNDEDWPGSSRGDAVDITAPGQDVYVPIIDQDDFIEDFSYGSGTSYATPHVAAAAALWLSQHKEDLLHHKGWHRVEAFRQALYQSSRESDMLPSDGFGYGILDVQKLLATKPLEPHQLQYAYNGWNEHAFMAMLQGYGQMIKTYWNRLRGKIFGVSRGDQESIAEGPMLSTEASLLELAKFGGSVTITSESPQAERIEFMDLRNRFNILTAEATAKVKYPEKNTESAKKKK